MPSNAQYGLHGFNSFANRILQLDPEQIDAFFNERPLNQQIAEFIAEGNNARRAFKDTICKSCYAFHLKNFTNIHEKDTIVLLNDLEEWLEGNPGAVDERCITLCRGLITELETFLLSIRASGKTPRVPQGLYKAGVEKISRKGLRLQQQMENAGVDLALQGVILGYVNEFCAKKSCSYRKLDYMTLFMKRLLKLFKKDRPVTLDWNTAIGAELILMDFNRPDFMSLCQDYIRADISPMQSPTEKKNGLMFHRRQTEKLGVLEGVAYRKTCSFKSTLLRFIDTELSHYDRDENMTLEFSSAMVKQPKESLKESEERLVADGWWHSNEVLKALGICSKTLYNYNKKKMFDTSGTGRNRLYSKTSVMLIRAKSAGRSETKR